MTRIINIVAFLLCGMGPISAQPLRDFQAIEDSRAPNILFILVDDLGWNGLSCYGNPYVKTANIDRLARQGMKFTHFYAPSMCCPSRVQLLSGEYGTRTGVTEQSSQRIYPYAPLITPKNNPNKLPEDNYTIANMLRDAGYATMISGKWNIGDDYRVADLKNKYGNQYFKPYGFDYIGDAREKNWDKEDKDKGNTAIVDDFFQFVDRIKKRPFFSYLAFFAPHTPIEAPDSLVRRFTDRGFPKSTDRFGDAREKPTANYLAMIKYLDYSIGELLDGLKQRGLDNNTIVIFTSDNGGMNRDWNNCPLRGAKGQTYDGGIRVPLLVRWPGHVSAGSQTDTPIGNVDWYPTFMSIANQNVPKSKTLDGISIIPLLAQKGDFHQQPLYFHRPQYNDDYGRTPSSAIILGNYKLIHYYGDYLDTRGFLPQQGEPFGNLIIGEKNLLFNIEKDPGERHDLSDKNPQITRVLLDSLKNWLTRTRAAIPIKNPDMNISKWAKRAHITGNRKTKKADFIVH